jgi:chromosome segregation ATPase
MRYGIGLIALIATAGLAAGCGGGGSATRTGTGAVAGTTVSLGTTTSPAATSADCRRLSAAGRQAVTQVANTLSGFTTVNSMSALQRRLKTLQLQIKRSTTRIEQISTHSQQLARDKTRFTDALTALSHRLASARQAAAAGNVGTATQRFTSLAQLQGLRSAAASLAADCPRTSS